MTPAKPTFDPETQVHRFNRAIAERLGLDTEIVEGDTFVVSFETDGEDAKVSVGLVAHLPADEVIALWNGSVS